MRNLLIFLRTEYWNEEDFSFNELQDNKVKEAAQWNMKTYFMEKMGAWQLSL